MKVELQLQVTQQQIFDLLTKSILTDIETTTGKSLPVDQINGFSYTKSITTKLGVANQVDIIISSYIVPSVYEAKAISKDGEYVFRYDLSPVDDTNCQVTYTETFDSPKWFLRLNQSIFSMLYLKKSKQRLIGSIRYMEHMILHPELMEKKENQEETEPSVLKQE